MKIEDINDFILYYEKIKKRTQRLFQYIPEDKIEWTFRESKFTIGDQIRHIANIERHMFIETIQQKTNKYTGGSTKYADGLNNVINYYNSKYKESLLILKSLDSNDLLKKCKTPGNIEITVWKWLRAMIEHEIHHRAQLYLYLSILKIETPPMFGLSAEKVIENSKIGFHSHK